MEDKSIIRSKLLTLHLLTRCLQSTLWEYAPSRQIIKRQNRVNSEIIKRQRNRYGVNSECSVQINEQTYYYYLCYKFVYQKSSDEKACELFFVRYYRRLCSISDGNYGIQEWASKIRSNLLRMRTLYCDSSHSTDSTRDILYQKQNHGVKISK